MTFCIFHRHRVCLVDHVDLICSLYSWWEGLGSSSLATLPLCFNCSFISTSARGSSTGVPPGAALEDLGLPLWGPGVEVVQLLGLQGFWQCQVLRGVGSQGSRKYSALEGYGNQYWPIRSSTLAWRPPPWQRRLAGHSLQGRRVGHDLSDSVCIVARLFLPAAGLPQWELSVKVARLLGLWGSWWCQVCRDTDCLCHRSYGPIRIFFLASCSWQSEGLFGQSFSVAPPI